MGMKLIIGFLICLKINEIVDVIKRKELIVVVVFKYM